MNTLRTTAALAIFGILSTTANAQGIFSGGLFGSNNQSTNNCNTCGPNGCGPRNGNTGFVPQLAPGNYNSPQTFAPYRQGPGLNGQAPQPHDNVGSTPYFNDQYRGQTWQQSNQYAPRNGTGPQYQGQNQGPMQNRPFDIRQNYNNLNQNRQPLPGNPMFTEFSNYRQPAPSSVQPPFTNGWSLN